MILSTAYRGVVSPLCVIIDMIFGKMPMIDDALRILVSPDGSEVLPS